MKYLCLAYEEEKKLNDLSKDEWTALRKETLDYVEELRKSGHYIVSEALESVQTATTVRVRNGKLLTTDGPFAETKEQLGGIFLIDARDLDEAVRWPRSGHRRASAASKVRPIVGALRPDSRYGRD